VEFTVSKKNDPKRMKRKQKKALKRTRRTKARTPKAPVSRKAPTVNWPADEFLFWVAHGANYILSDYANGTWQPLFENIYEGGAPPSLNKMQSAIMAKFGPDNGDWPPEGRAVLAWTVQTVQAVYTFYQDSKRRAEGHDPEGDIEALVRQPHYSPVWEAFDFLKQQLAARSA